SLCSLIGVNLKIRMGPPRRQSSHAQHSDIAKSVIRSNFSSLSVSKRIDDHNNTHGLTGACHNSTSMPLSKTVVGRAGRHLDSHRSPLTSYPHPRASRDGVGVPLSDSPVSTAPPSPQMLVLTLLYFFLPCYCCQWLSDPFFF